MSKILKILFPCLFAFSVIVSVFACSSIIETANIAESATQIDCSIGESILVEEEGGNSSILYYDTANGLEAVNIADGTYLIYTEVSTDDPVNINYSSDSYLYVEKHYQKREYRNGKRRIKTEKEIYDVSKSIYAFGQNFDTNDINFENIEKITQVSGDSYYGIPSDEKGTLMLEFKNGKAIKGTYYYANTPDEAISDMKSFSNFVPIITICLVFGVLTFIAIKPTKKKEINSEDNL